MMALRKLTLIDIRLYLREPIGTFFTIAFPALLVLLFGAIFGNEPSEMFGGYGSMDISMPGYTALIVATVGMLNVPIITTGYRETGVLRRLKVTPLRPLTYIVADLVSNLIMVVVGMALVVLLGRLIYQVRFEGQVWAVALGVVYSFLAMAALGYLIAGVAPSQRAANIIGMIILYPMLFLSGSGMPIEVLPEGIRKISAFLPLTYVVRLLRGLWFGQPWSDLWLPVVVLGVMIVVFGLLAGRLFKWE